MSKTDEIYQFVAGKIKLLSRGDSWSTAMLAKLRRGVGTMPGTVPEIWEVTINDLPDDLASYQGLPSYGEWAVHLALTLFALHQQGKDIKGSCVSQKGNSFGRAVSFIIAPDGSNEAGIKRRFNAALTAKDLNEFAYHARGLVQLMKANEVSLDYPGFSMDLFWLQMTDNRRRVLLRWAEDYYHVKNILLDSSDSSSSNNRGE